MSAREIAEKVLANKAALSYAEEAALARAYLEAEKALRETYELLLAGEADNALHALDAFLILAEHEPVAQPPERTVCPECGRDLHGYRGPLCRYCDGTAE